MYTPPSFVAASRPATLDHRDLDFFGSHMPGGIGALPAFPAQYDVDRGLWVPDQNSYEPIWRNPALPYGCTDYGTADACSDLDGVLKNPALVEAVTHANANGGGEVRDSLLAARGLGWLGWFFQVRAQQGMDWFDAFRLAQAYGGLEQRAITWTTPWFRSWENAIQGTRSVQLAQDSWRLEVDPAGRQYVMPMPTNQEMAAIRADPAAFGWHDSVLTGWHDENGSPVYRDKSWQGASVGRGGFVAFPREVIDAVMTIGGTVAFTATLGRPPALERVQVDFLEWLKSNANLLLGLQY